MRIYLILRYGCGKAQVALEIQVMGGTILNIKIPCYFH